jgi:hypothetical protein
MTTATATIQPQALVAAAIESVKEVASFDGLCTLETHKPAGADYAFYSSANDSYTFLMQGYKIEMNFKNHGEIRKTNKLKLTHLATGNATKWQTFTV